MSKDKIVFLFVVNSYEREYLGIMQISACLKQDAIPVHICLSQRHGLRKKLSFLCNAYDKVVVGYSVPTVFFDFYLQLNFDLKKEFDFIAVFGGPHPTYFPEIIIQDSIDIICRGEGAYPALELMKSLRQGILPEGIKNLWIKKNGKIIKNALRPLVKNLDLVPFADRALFRDNAQGGNSHNMIMVASRGCPLECSYCFSHAFRVLNENKNVDTRRSVPSVIQEIEQCRIKYDIQFVSFCDSIFTLNKQWLDDFSKQYSQKIKIPFYCNVHPNYVDAQAAQMLAAAGCSVVGMGIECGEENIRFKILNRPISDNKLIAASRIIKKHKIKIASGNIIAIPQAGIDADLQTLKLNIQCKVDYPEIFIMSLHPGTEIYKQFAQKQYEGNPAVNQVIPTMNSLGVFYANSKIFTCAMEKRMTMNLQNLFGVIVAFPWLYPAAKFLIRLPLKKLYMVVFTIFESVKTFTYKNSYKNLFKRVLIQVLIIKNRLINYESVNPYK